MRGSSYKRCESVYLAVPTRVVVDVDDACCSSSIDASLHEGVVLHEVRVVDRANNVVHQELPAHGKTESGEVVVAHKVVHLALAVMTVVLKKRWVCGDSLAVAVGVAAEVESSNVHAGVLQLAGVSWRSRKRAGC